MYLIDTDIIIYSLKNHDVVVKNFKKHLDEPKSISVITFGELLYGAYRSGKKTQNLARVRRIKEIFPVIDISGAIIETFSQIKAGLSMEGVCVDDFDLLIGATALTMNYKIVTNNEKYFKKIPGLGIENWCKA